MPSTFTPQERYPYSPPEQKMYGVFPGMEINAPDWICIQKPRSVVSQLDHYSKIHQDDNTIHGKNAFRKT